MRGILIKSLNLLINLDQVTDVKFSPIQDFDYEDEEDYDEQGNMKVKHCHKDATLKLVMTSLTDKIISQWDGDYQGAVSVSREIQIIGPEAEQLWRYLSNPTYVYLI